MQQDAHDRERSPLFDRADRIDQTRARRDVEGTGGELLDRRGIRLRKDDVELEIDGVEIAVLLADIDRPEAGRSGVDRAGQDSVGGMRRWRAEERQGKAETG